MYFTSFFQVVAVLLSLNALIGTVEGAAPFYVNVGSCKTFAVVAGATITNDGYSVVNGDMGLSPGSSVVGFPVGQVVGTQHITNGPAAACIADLALAIINAKARTPDMLMTGELGGMTLTPGVYKSGSGYVITNILYLDGQNKPEAAWIFIMATTLTVNSGASVVMQNYDDTNGVSVWWSVGTRADIKVGAAMQGTIMASQSIAVMLGAATGPLFAHIGEVTLLENMVASYPQLQQQTAQPVRAPTRSPTARPSRGGKNQRVTLSVDQKVTGVSEEDYEEDKPANDRTIQQALADSVAGLSFFDVTDLACKEIGFSSTSTPPSCLLSYKITSDTADMTYEKLAAQLIKAAVSGKLLVAIRKYAEINDAEKLLDASVAIPMVENASPESDSSSSSNKLTEGGIAGIVIGCVVGVALLGFLVFLILHTTSTSKPAHTPVSTKEDADVQVQVQGVETA